MKKGLLFLLLFFAATVSAGDRELVEFRLKKDPNAPVRGWLTAYDDEGFDFQKFGGAKTRVRWADLVEEEATRLRQRFRLELTEDEKKGLMAGHALYLKGGGDPIIGKLERIDGEDRHWMRQEGLLLPYPGDRVESVQERKVPEAEVYSKDDIYVRRLKRRPPETALDHRRLGDYLYDVGSFSGSYKQYGAALALRPEWRPELEERLEELKEYMEDAAAASVFQKAKRLANLDYKYDEAKKLVEDYVERAPGARRRGYALIADIERTQLSRKRTLFHRVKNDEFDRAVKRFLRSQKPDFDAARSWATTEMPKEVESRVRERLEMSDGEWELLAGSEAQGAPHFASYWSGSFIVSKRAAHGKSSKRVIRGDPSGWWDKYQDVSARASFLKAYAAERLDMFEVVYVRNTPCDRCGGKGVVTKSSVEALADGRHEWQETCRRCYGARVDRGIAYR